MAIHRWLWLNDELSDVKLRLVCVNPPPAAGAGDLLLADAPRHPENVASSGTSTTEGGDAASALEVLMELPVHRVVLASVSEYWKTRFLRWCTTATAATTSEVHGAASNASNRAGKGQPNADSVSKTSIIMLQEQLHGLHEVTAARKVLQHAYTGILPEEPALTLLMQMALVADRWGMPDTVEACLQQAAAVQQLTIDNIKSLLYDDWPSTIHANASFKSICSTALLKQFGRAQAIVADPESLKAFCSLTLHAVQLWAQQDALKVDSENTVAVLFTHWWDKNSHSLDEDHMAAACNVLTESIIADQLSSTFALDTLVSLPWFRPSQKAARILRLLHGTLSEQDSSVQSVLPAAWSKEGHAEDTEQDTVLEWVITRADLDMLHNKAGEEEGEEEGEEDSKEGDSELYSTNSLYWAGYRWQLGISLSDQKSPLFAGLKYSSAMPETIHNVDVPPILPVTFVLALHGQEGPVEEECYFGKTWPMSATELCGCERLLGMDASPEPRANSYPPRNLWKNGKLHLRVKLQDVE